MILSAVINESTYKISTIVKVSSEIDFKEIALSEALAILSKFSGQTIIVKDTSIANLKISLYMPANQSLSSIIQAIENKYNLQRKIENNTIVLEKFTQEANYSEEEPLIRKLSSRGRIGVSGDITNTLQSDWSGGNADMMSAPSPSWYPAPNNFNTAEFNPIEENGFHKTLNESLSTFSIDVDKASYSLVRNEIQNGRMPSKDMVKVEELINYFDYNYPAPEGKTPFSVNTEVGDCDWNKEHKLALIQLKGKTFTETKKPKSNLVFLIDVSGSMNSQEKLPLIIKSLKILSENLAPEDVISVVVYASAEGVALPATKGKDKRIIINALDKLQAGGSTAGGAGIQLAYKIAEENFIKNSNNRVILCTDGDFNIGISDTGSLVDIVKQKKQKGIGLTVIGVGTDNLKDSRMEQLADKGDGNYFFIDGINEARKVFVQELKGTLFTIAKDVKIQVEFNPAKVKAYKLIGYENRLLNKEDFKDDKKDAGELGAGHTVTAIYELVLENRQNLKDNDELKYINKNINNTAYKTDEIITVKLRYKEPNEDTSKEIQKAIKNDFKNTQQISNEFKFASAVAEFGLLLRNSSFKENASYNRVLDLARAGKGEDYYGYRAEFIQLVENAKLLDKEENSNTQIE